MAEKPTYEELEQKVKEFEQAKSEYTNLMSILNIIPDGVYIVSQQCDIEYINSVIEREFGPVDGRKCYKYFHDRTEACPWCKNAEVFAGKSVQWEWHSIKNDRHYDLFDTPIKNDDGSISKFEIFHDITERKKAEDALRESEEKQRLLLKNIPQKIFYKDNSSVYVSCNENYARDLKMSSDEITGKTDYDFYSEELADKYRADDQRIMRSRGPEEIEEEYIQDSEKFIVQTIKTAVYNNDGIVIGLLGIFRDITERKQAEEMLRESEKKYKDLFERSLDCIYIHDFESNFIDLNPAALNLLGYTKEEIPSLNFASLLNEDGLLKAFNDTRDIMAKNVGHDLSQYKLKKKNGDYVYIETKGSLIYKDDKPYSVMGIARDINERKQAEEKLTKLYEELEERVEERTRDLAEVNTALKVLLKRRGEDQTEMEEKILVNVNEMITPLINTLKGTQLDGRQSTWLEMLEANLSDIVSPFSRKLHSRYWRLTPNEFQVANFIRNGKSTKEIAKLLGVATGTIDTYRDNIRKKLGIKNKKINLKTYLFDLE